jgi:hypothetical protein
MRDPLWMEGDDVALGKDEEDTTPNSHLRHTRGDVRR